MPSGEKNAKLSPEQKDEIVRRYTTRLPDGTWEGTTTLARDFGVRHATIRRWLRLRGVTMRDAREAHSGGKRCKPVTNLPPEGVLGPDCKCGCGEKVTWSRQFNKWSVYAFGHAPGGTRAGIPRGTRTREERSLEAPLCKCGCGEVVLWNQGKNRWNVYVTGHYRRDAPYKGEAWLREQYIDQRRSVAEIARECGVGFSTVVKFINKFQIPRQPVDHKKQGSPGARNPSWKGGVAKWPYSPDWKALARSIRNRDKWTCQDCGEQRVKWGIHLHVHHIDGNKLNNDPANLISLCAKCHRRRHAAEHLGELETHAA